MLMRGENVMIGRSGYGWRMLSRRASRAGRSLVLVMLAALIGLSAGGTGGRVASASGPAELPAMTATAAKPSGWPSFLIGASYQGPAARSWRGDYWAWWADDLFDAQLVDDDFARAEAAGLNTLRVFVQ